MNAVVPLRIDMNHEMVVPSALGECVAKATRRYLHDLGPHSAGDLYWLVLAEVERPLLDEVLMHCRGNQSKAAKVLGITRATLRKKILEKNGASGR